MILTLMLLARNISAASYGHYQFYRNYGEGFYDYGPNDYHAINGSTAEEDVNDGIYTDRGVFLDGISHYVTVHNNHWGTPPSFSLSFEIALFFLPLDDGILIHRYNEYNNTLLMIRLHNLEKIIVKIARTENHENSYELVTIETNDNIVSIGKWYYLQITMEDHDPDIKCFIYLNNSHIISESINTINYQEYTEAYMTMGKGTGNKLKAIVYSLHMYTYGSIDGSTIFSTSCTPNDSDCLICPAGNSVCLLHLDNPYVNNNGVSCADCINGCFTDMSCMDCPSSSLPFCQRNDSSSLPPVCDLSCSGCTGPGVEGCIGCQDTDRHIPSPPGECVCINGNLNADYCAECADGCQSCQEPDLCEVCIDPNASPKSDGSGECECNSGYYLDSDNDCSPCWTDCLTCDSSSCLTCTVSGAVPTSGQTCSCPSNSSFNGTECICESEFYDSDTSPSLQCDPCHSDCLTCNDSSLCLTCKDSLAIPSASEGCECVSNLIMSNSACVCMSGYYKNTSNACDLCPSTCLECNSTTCTVCAISKAIPGEGYECSCPVNSTLEDSECKCNDEFYYNSGVCEKCHEDCETCEDSKLCLSCKISSQNPDPVEGCSCPLNSALQDGTCQCNNRFFMNASEVCESCEEDCASCDGSRCIECLDNKAYVNTEGKCECPEGSEMVEGQCKCLEGYEWSSSFDSCIQSVNVSEEILKFSNSTLTIIASGTVTAAGFSTTILNDPMSLWTLINTVQVFSYIPLHNVKLTSKIEMITKSFEITNFIPNIILVFYGRSNTKLKTDKENWETFTKSASFYENIGECITALALAIVVLGLLSISFLMFPCWKTGILKKLFQFKFGVFLRLLVELYLVLVYGSLLSFSDFSSNSETNVENTIGSIVFFLCVLTPCIITLLLYKLKTHILEQGERIDSSYKTLFSEFHVTESFRSLIYYPCFLARRLVYMVSLFYFYKYPKVQFAIDTTSTVCMILVLTTMVKFRSKGRFMLELSSEIIIFTIFVALSLINLDLSDDAKDGVEMTVIVLAFVIIGANFLYILGIAVVQICERCKKKKTQNVAKVIPISKPNLFAELDPVFAQPRGIMVRENISQDQDRTYLNQNCNDLY